MFTINSISFIDLSISPDKIFIISSNNLLTESNFILIIKL